MATVISLTVDVRRPASYSTYNLISTTSWRRALINDSVETRVVDVFELWAAVNLHSSIVSIDRLLRISIEVGPRSTTRRDRVKWAFIANKVVSDCRSLTIFPRDEDPLNIFIQLLFQFESMCCFFPHEEAEKKKCYVLDFVRMRVKLLAICWAHWAKCFMPFREARTIKCPYELILCAWSPCALQISAKTGSCWDPQ